MYADYPEEELCEVDDLGSSLKVGQVLWQTKILIVFIKKSLFSD